MVLADGEVVHTAGKGSRPSKVITNTNKKTHTKTNIKTKTNTNKNTLRAWEADPARL